VLVIFVVLGLVSAVVQAFGVGVVLLIVVLLGIRLRSICFLHPFYGYFLSSGLVFSSCFLISAASLSSVRLPSLVIFLPLFFVVSIRPAVSSCCRIFLMLVPPPFLVCSRMAPLRCLPPYSARNFSMPIGPCV